MTSGQGWGYGLARFVVAKLEIGAGTAGICALPQTPDDLECIRQFAPDLVVSLTQSHEMRDAGAGQLDLDMASAGLNWLHLPVPDFGVPGDAPGWDAAQLRIDHLLAGGGRVLVHCRAGLGRSGAVLLRLMVAAGEGPETALLRLRAVRPGAVETDAQWHWAAAQDGAQNGTGDAK